MPPLVFDFPAIASRLRKDEFYTPRAKETKEDVAQCCGWCGCIDIRPKGDLFQCQGCGTTFR